MKKWFRIGLIVLLGMGLLALSLVVSACPAMGASASGARLERMQTSAQWRGKSFGNHLPRVDGDPMQMVSEFLWGGSAHRRPAQDLPVQYRSAAEFETFPASGLRVTWLGHSSLLVELDGTRIFFDPVFGEYASPFTFAGPKRFFPPPLPLEELPELDAVIISHDHYDHLDHPTVLALQKKVSRWFVPLGVGAHLESWGVPPEAIRELDWWESSSVNTVQVTCTPSRHFSGRSLGDQNATLWAGWALAGPTHRVFYSGDTALHPEFAEIGDRLGPFDLTLIESGAYNQLWSDVHLGPEQAVLAHQLVRGQVMLPVHWGLFDLALHGWTEPIERVLAAAEKAGVRVVAPKPGASVELSDAPRIDRWWPNLPWQSAENAPAWSSSVLQLQRPLRAGAGE